jgi:hypothetical protein
VDFYPNGLFYHLGGWPGMLVHIVEQWDSEAPVNPESSKTPAMTAGASPSGPVKYLVK